MWLMQIGEVVFGGVGSGLYGMMLFVLWAVFIAGLMIGRTPEYLGKKIDVREMKLTALAILVTPTLVLMGAALAMMTDAGRSANAGNPGPHGFSEVLYAVSSAANNNNGSAFAGLSANSPFWNCLLAFCMFVGRFGVIIPVMAIAGSLVSKKSQPASAHCHTVQHCCWPVNRHRVAGWRTDLYPCPGAWPGGGISLLMILSEH